MSFASTLGVVPPVALGIVAGVSFTASIVVTTTLEVAVSQTDGLAT